MKAIIRKSLNVFVLVISATLYLGAADVQEIYLYFEQDKWDYIYENWEEEIYIPCTVKFDGKEWTDCEMRFRGDGSKALPRKSIKVKFNDKPFATGREKLNLNVDFYDRTRCHNHLSSMLFNLTGYPTFKTEHYRVYCNDVYSGLYISVENMDEKFLAERGLKTDDNMYKATNDGACLHYRDEIESVWEKKTNEREPWNDLKNMIMELNQIPNDKFYAFMNDKFDYDNVVNFISLSLLLTNASTYSHNYYMFHNTKLGKWQIFAWDMDKTFSTYGLYYLYRTNSDIWFYDNPLFARCMDNEKIFADIKARIDKLAEDYFNKDFMEPILDSLENVLVASALQDTLFNFTAEDQFAKEFDKELEYIDRKRVVLYEQFKKNPGMFECSAPDEIEFDSFLVTWDKAENNDDEGEILYRFYYGDNPNFTYGWYEIVEGIKDTSFMMNVLPKEGKYYYRVDAYNSVTNAQIMSYHKKNKLYYMPNVSRIKEKVTDKLVLKEDKSPYLIDGDLTVEKGGEIIIEPGVTVYFSGFDNKVYGEFKADGTKEKPIKLLSKYDLKTVTLTCYQSDDLIIKNAEMKNIRVMAYDVDVIVKDVNFSINQINSELLSVGIYVSGKDSKVIYDNIDLYGQPKLEALFVHDCKETRVENCKIDNCAEGIEITNVRNNCLIRGNLIQNNSDDAIDMNSCENVSIIANRIFNIKDKGISLEAPPEYDNPKIEIKRNVICKTGTGIAIKNNLHGIVQNNTISQTGTAISVYEKEASSSGLENNPKLTGVNNIFHDCGNIIYYDEKASGTINYSLSDNSEIDGNNNLKADPLFENVEEYNFTLQPNSPCVDAGDPNGEKDEDGTIADLGAIQTHQISGKTDDIVINEINYNSADDKDSGDWVELYNNSNSTVKLKDWYFSDSDNTHKFLLPDIELEHQDYLVIYKEEDNFRDIYGKINPAIGEFDFGLSKGGELIRLFKSNGEMVDFVEYDDKFPWPEDADGKGKTLELINPSYDNALPESWKDSEEKGGSPCRPNSGVDTVDENRRTHYEVYPNPCKEVINFIFENIDEGFTYTVIDINGREYFKDATILKNGEIQIDTSVLVVGVYYLLITNDNGKILIPIVKE